ncbi:hypothetical protein VCUG_01464 [Vavraia culicis subsp. floridensis]|uniref:Asparagine synthetase domain-containing protein n=1 Tax=Vavraia culicis (isolate floridensis) TaxID=948595 RepID=L2GTS5_VAVCU|nr:uncharacterized protein VCUG_01464 [Vavraia culicis subsp. floridensis]ELA47019.1 hypothetical protein VCUG_01464 [Vavraia culicis subsp. floridensis]
MCGIIVANSTIPEKTKKMAMNRGPDAITETKVSNFTFISTTLSIRDCPTRKNGESILLYNGEIYNGAPSDTDSVQECLETICECAECFCVVKKVYEMVNAYENEVAICFYFKNCIYFFKDDVGRKSFGFTITDVFYAGSVGFEIEANPNLLYQYRLRDHKLLCVPKDENTTCHKGQVCQQNEILHGPFLLKQGVVRINWCEPKDLESQARILENLLIQSCRRRVHRFDSVILFGGGIDSLIVAMVLNKVLEKEKAIYLVNTSFDEKKSWDRSYGLANYQALCDVYKEREFVFVENDVSLEEVSCVLPMIEALVYPKTSVMDVNIGLCHYFSAKRAKNYTKVVYTGMGADELFGGYAKYLKGVNNARLAIDRDVKTLFRDNIGRDDRIIADNAVEMRAPFLDKDVVKFALGLDLPYLVNAGEHRNEQCGKVILRKILSLSGFENESEISKKAVQFGSGLKKQEKKFR